MSSSGQGQKQNVLDTAACGMVKPTGENLDLAWQWNSLKDINNRKSVTCDFCLKTTTGGITRAKRHQMGIRGDVGACKKIPLEIKKKLVEAYQQKKAENEENMAAELHGDEDDLEEVQEIHLVRTGKKHAAEGGSAPKKAKNAKGPLDLLFMKRTEASLGKVQRQTNIKDACDKEARAMTNQYIARFFYRNSIPFNVAKSKSFTLMVEAIGNYGRHLKPPSYHELRVPLLKKELELTREMMKPLEEERLKFGCSIMSDGWTDRKNRTLINFLVNCPRGTMFVRSVDASSFVKTGEKVFELLNSFIDEIGEENIVQVITDNGSNYVLAGKYLQARRPHIFWTPCASHCLDLMLEDIGKIPKVKRTIERGCSLVGFIYNHSLALNLMRKFTKKMELVRHGVTRFATTFLTLNRLHKQKSNLRKMFISDEWLQSKNAKEMKGKKATDIVMMPTFWNEVLYTLKVMGPLVRVLRLVDNEKKPAMGYIYEAMDRAKEAIERAFKKKEDKYKDVFEIIDRRWECQLHHPLHAAGHFLNPQFYYLDPRIEFDPEVTNGLYKCIERLSTSEEEVDKITMQLSLYKRADGIFGLNAAIRQRQTLAPAEWWRNYGCHVPNLQKLAIKVLSLTCSSSGCERNWSTFEHIHSKKRSKLESQKLQDLVYIKYNQNLIDRYDNRDVIDPIALDDIDDCNEWLIGEMGESSRLAEDELVFDGDDLTWGVVAEATGANEPANYTRQQARSRKGKNVMQDEEPEMEVDEGSEEEEYIEKSCSEESGNEEENYLLETDSD